MELSTKTIELGCQITATATPDRCRNCKNLPQRMGRLLAVAVQEGRIEESEAVEQMRTVFDEDCPAGPLNLTVNGQSIEQACRREPTLEIPRVIPLGHTELQPAVSLPTISDTRAMIQVFDSAH